MFSLATDSLRAFRGERSAEFFGNRENGALRFLPVQFANDGKRRFPARGALEPPFRFAWKYKKPPIARPAAFLFPNKIEPH